MQFWGCPGGSFQQVVFLYACDMGSGGLAFVVDFVSDLASQAPLPAQAFRSSQIAVAIRKKQLILLPQLRGI